MKNVNIGIIGVNGRGRLWRFWHNPAQGVTVSAGADKDLAELEKFKERCNKDAFTTLDYKEMIKRPDLDGIVVATPDFLHAQMVIESLEAGKFVYCEKPLATTVEDADRMISCSNAHPGKLMVGFNMRYMPFVKLMKEIVDSGEIGEIKAVWVRHFVGMGSIYYYHDWHADKRNTGSLLLQKGSHDIDVIHFVTGHNTVKAAAFGGLDFFGGKNANTLECTQCDKKDSCIDSQVPVLDMDGKPARRFCAFRKEVDVPDNYTCLFELDNGIRVSYNECHFTPDYHRNYTFIGTKGRLENSEIDGTVKVWYRKNGRNDQPDRVIDLKIIEQKETEVGHGGADPLICAEFVRMIRGEITAPVPPEAGRNAVIAGLAAQYSLEHGGIVVPVNPS